MVMEPTTDSSSRWPKRLAGLKKHNDMFNVYINYAASVQAKSDADHKWGAAFANRLLRLEIKGNLTDRLYYRLPA